MEEHYFWEIFNNVVANWLQSRFLPAYEFFFFFLFHVTQGFYAWKFVHEGFEFVWRGVFSRLLIIFLRWVFVRLGLWLFFSRFCLTAFILTYWRICFFFFRFILVFDNFWDILLTFSLLNSSLLFLKFLLSWFLLISIVLDLLRWFLFLIAILVFIF